MITGKKTSYVSMNVAITLLAASIVTSQLAVPLQAPLQSVKLEPVSAVAIKVTTVP